MPLDSIWINVYIGEILLEVSSSITFWSDIITYWSDIITYWNDTKVAGATPRNDTITYWRDAII